MFIVSGEKQKAKWGVDESLLDKVKRTVTKKCISGHFFQNKRGIAEISALK